ncbi:ATP-binding protein [Microseira sp. BLCC-F43]|jgi:signal transduction histidine kinase|uniref:ATP-binding protein n=1 Tax=Microseira sp. BLCC-F43 TaxID=3153602 RepID=UPI0035B79826
MSSLSDPTTTISDEVLMLVEDDEMLLLDDSEVAEVSHPNSHLEGEWKVLIVDDEPAIHQATAIALKGFTFEGKGLNILSAYSGKAAKQMMVEHPDIAFILLDVVMETNDAGLQVVQYIREELQNRQVRIILRTGQPGDAPEESVILKYDINDYKLKVELTRQKLITVVISVLRAYRDIKLIEQQNQQLQHAQLQLIQREKMSALGNLVAGVAHEINNPVGFLGGNIQPALDYIQDLFGLLDMYQEKYPNSAPEIQDRIEQIDLEFIRQDLPKLVGSMQEGIDRICNISNSLRTFSRADSDTPVPFNLHQGLDSTILILKHRLKANETRPEISVIKNYGKIPPVNCFAGQLNQVFMNILANGIDAIDEKTEKWKVSQPCIQISTEVLESAVVIRIQDNGMGIPEEVKAKIFDRLFTTKSVGQGTGLGLAIAHQIIVEKHGGAIDVNSEVGKGTEFVLTLPIC